MQFKKLLLLILFAGNVASAQIAAWDIRGHSSPPTLAAEVFDSGLDSNNLITRGPGAPVLSASNSFRTNGFQNNGISTANTDYFQVTLSATPGNVLSLSTIDAKFNGTATFSASPGVSHQFAYSLDGVNFTLIGSPQSIAGSTTPFPQINVSGIAALQNVADNVTITLRYYASGQTTTGGWGFYSPADNQYGLAIDGSIDSAFRVDWCNLQFPGNVTVNQGTNVTFYARAYEASVTPGAGSAIEAWIGYSSTDSTPGDSWTWISAPFNVSVGNNDEYFASFGALLPEGTYYVASRFELDNSGSYTYGGFSTGGGNFWDGNTYRSAVLTINGPTSVDDHDLYWPDSGSIALGSEFIVYAQVFEPGVTTIPNAQGEGINAWIGYSTSDTNPAVDPSWTWVAANYNPFFVSDPDRDEYMLDLGAQVPAVGTYYYASRFQYETGEYRYGGIASNGNGGAWDGTLNKSGVLTVTPPLVQEITVRAEVGFNPTITSGDTSPIGTDNTLFAAQNIGASQMKSYRIYNIGTANLNVSSIALVGGNPGDFIVGAAAPYVITPGNYITFTITFQPVAAGVRSTTVTIANNDSNENPYTFLIQGTGTCVAASNTITPFSGPVGTEVTVVSAEDLSAATAAFNGVPASITHVSTNEIKIIVPDGAVSGNLEVINTTGCTATNAFTVIDNTVSGCQGTSTLPADLFISQVTDSGTDGMTYIEIYNATGATVNLSSYSLRFYNNGSSSVNGGNVTLSNVNLLNNDVYVVATGLNNPLNCTSVPGGNAEYSDQQYSQGGINFKVSSTENNNMGHDHFRLYRNAAHIDSWGTFEDASWAVPLDLEGEGANFSRKVTASVPSVAFSLADWDIVDWEDDCASLDYGDIGTFDFSAGDPPIIIEHPTYIPTCKSTSFTVEAEEGFPGNNLLAYQWYVAAPGATVWTALSNGGVYSGVTDETLNISSVAGLNDYQYYVQVRENGVTCYTASNAVKIAAGTATWNGSAWSPAPPTINDVAVINGNYNTAAHGDFEACSLTVNGVSTLTIFAGDYVAIQNDLTVNNSATLQVLNQGSLVMIDDDGVVTNTGTTQIQKTTTPYNQFDYTYWSSPVAPTTIGAVFPLWRLDFSFSFLTSNFSDTEAPLGFDDDNNSWIFAGGGTAMTPGKGYAIMAPTTGTFPATSTVTFSGSVNNGIITLPLLLSANPADENDDYNLIGNPYPSAIFADDFIATNLNTSGTLYFWTHRTGVSSSNPGPDQYNFITDDYAVYNLSGGTSASGPGSPEPTGYIASGQGFFVEAVTASNVVFNNSMRDKLYANDNFYRMAQSAAAFEKDRIWLNFANTDGLFSQQLIGYFDAASMDYDRGYDGIVNHSPNSVSFYSFIGPDKYRIQGRSAFDENDRVPLGYSSNIAGIYTISIGKREGRLNDEEIGIFLEDKLLGITHDLRNSAYTFTTTTGAFDDRFLLKYTDVTLGTDNPSINAVTVLAYASGDQINVRSMSEPIHTIEVFDMLGRLIRTSTDIADQNHTISGIIAGRQPLVLRIVLESGHSVTRKIIF